MTRSKALRRYYECPANLFIENVRPARPKDIQNVFECENCMNFHICDGPRIVHRDDSFIANIFVSLYKQGVPIKMLTEAYGLAPGNRTSIASMLKSKGVKLLSPSESRIEGQKWDALARNSKYIAQLYLLGVPAKVIGEAYDTDSRNIYLILKREKVELDHSKVTSYAKRFYNSIKRRKQ